MNQSKDRRIRFLVYLFLSLAAAFCILFIDDNSTRIELLRTVVINVSCSLLAVGVAFFIIEFLFELNDSEASNMRLVDAIDKKINDKNLRELEAEKNTLDSVQINLSAALNNMESLRQGMEDLESKLRKSVVDRIVEDIKQNSSWTTLNQNQKEELSNQITTSINSLFGGKNGPFSGIQDMLNRVCSSQDKLQSTVSDVKEKQEKIIRNIFSLQNIADEYSRIVVQSEETRDLVETRVQKHVRSSLTEDQKIHNITEDVLHLFKVAITSLRPYTDDLHNQR